MPSEGGFRRPFGFRSEYGHGGFGGVQGGRGAPQQLTAKPLPPPLSDDQMLNTIRLPNLREGDAKMADYQLKHASAPVEGVVAPVPPKLYRPNVGVHFFNEYGQVLACLRRDKKSWQTVQGGVEDYDGVVPAVADSLANDFPFPIHGSFDLRLLRAAEREIAEEIGLEDLKGVGAQYVCTIAPPKRAEVEAILSKQQGAAGLSAATTDKLRLLEEDPIRFFRYEFEGMMGMKARQKGYVGQEQHQLVFFLPSVSIDKVNLIPDKLKYGADVTQEFKAVAWMDPRQFVPLCATMKQSMMAYVLSSIQYTAAVETFLSLPGIGGAKSMGEEELLRVRLVAPHVGGPPCILAVPGQRRPRSPDPSDDEKELGQQAYLSRL